MIKRIIYSDNGVLSDMSVNLNSYHSGSHTFSYVTGEDYFYIGSQLPFNHLYFKLGNVVNLIANTLASIQYWDSGAWIDAIDVIDETSGFSKSGFITWSTSRNKGWVRRDTNYGGSQITGLSTLDIYDLYWLRLSFDKTLTPSIVLSWIGNKFAEDNDLKEEHIDLTRSSFMTAYEAGKTDWEAQHVRAAELIIEDLIGKNMIIDRGQILKREELKSAAIKRVAHLIYSNMGKNYYDDRDLAKSEYEERINKVIPSLDFNANGRFDVNEYNQTGRLIR